MVKCCCPYLNRLSKLKKYAFLVLSVWLSFTAQAVAGDSLDEVLARHVIQAPEKIIYTQTKYNQYLSEPVRASGTIYIQPDYFVMQQDSPLPMLVVSNHERIWFYDIDKDRRYERKITRLNQKDPALNALITMLRFGDIKVLKNQFDIKIEALDVGWVLDMQPRHFQSKKIFKTMKLQGKAGKKVERFEIISLHNDSTVWQFDTRPFSDDTAEVVELLKQTARGL